VGFFGVIAIAGTVGALAADVLAGRFSRLKSCACAARLFPTLGAQQLVKRAFVRVRSVGAPCTGGRPHAHPRYIAAVTTRLGQSL